MTKKVCCIILGLLLVLSKFASANHAGLFVGIHKHKIVLNSSGYRQLTSGKIPKNCYQYLNPVLINTEYNGATGSGIYLIDPDGTGTQLPVYCDMVSDGGGWTLAIKIEHSTTPGDLSFSGTYNGATIDPSDRSGLKSPTLQGRAGWAVKLTNAQINYIRSSTASNFATYKVEKVVTSGGQNSGYRKLFYPGSCVFQNSPYGAYGSNTGCQQSATAYNATTFTGTYLQWCAQSNIPVSYMCSNGAEGFMRFNDSFMNSDSYNYFDHLVWIR